MRVLAGDYEFVLNKDESKVYAINDDGELTEIVGNRPLIIELIKELHSLQDDYGKKFVHEKDNAE